nr:hypothetical protein OG999_33650 [Streptomyces sp. NBC_00886]
MQVLSTLESFSDAIHSATFASGEYSWDQDQYFDAVKSLKRQHPPQNVLRRLSEANRRRVEVETAWRNSQRANRRNDQALQRSLLSYEATVEAFAVEAFILVRLSAV